jgi:hypothetical protein
MPDFNTPPITHEPEQPAKLSQRMLAFAGRLGARRVVKQQTATEAPTENLNAEQTLPESLVPYAESDTLVAVALPKLESLNLDDRTITVKTATGEDVSEATYINRSLEDTADQPEFRSRAQWLGEKELVYSLAEQSKWLAGRLVSGENIAVFDESWHRKGIKSGGYISSLIIKGARNLLDSSAIEPAGKLFTDDDVRKGVSGVIDRVVLFDDWIGSGHDMGQRVSWTKRLMSEKGIDESKLSINLLASRTSMLRDGFNGYFAEEIIRPHTRVIAPYEIEELPGELYPPFSGIHSDMDYSFTLKQEMHAAVEKRSDKYSHTSSYHIASLDTFGNSDFYTRIEEGLLGELQVQS